MVESSLKKNTTTSKLFNILLCIILFVLYFSPYFIKGTDVSILVHDNLDLINEMGIFNKTALTLSELKEVEPNLPGLEPHFRKDTIFISSFLFRLFGYFKGYIANEFFYRLIIFISFFILLKRYLQLQLPDYILLLLAFSFTALPYSPIGDLSVGSIPLIIMLFINLLRKQRVLLSYLLLVLVAFYSVFALTGIFVLIVLSVVYLVLCIRKKSLLLPFLGGIVVLSASYVLSHHNLFYSQFFSGDLSHRVEKLVQVAPLGESIAKAIKIFFLSQYHAHAYQGFIIIPTIAVTFFFLVKRKKEYKQELSLFIIMLAYQIFAAFCYGLYYYRPVSTFYNHLNIGFNFGRFYFLSPGLWYILFAMSISILYNVFKGKKFTNIVLLLLVILQIGLGFYKYTINAFTLKPTFSQIMSTDLFDTITEEIGLDKDTDRIGCIGFFPSVANYNGIKTVGAYSNYYSLSFKKRFGEVIKDELAQNSDEENYYYTWGNRVYLFDDELGKVLSILNYKDNYTESIRSDLNIRALSEFGVTYVFSTSRIINAEEKFLREVFRSTSDKYYYKMYVYKIVLDNE